MPFCQREHSTHELDVGYQQTRDAVPGRGDGHVAAESVHECRTGGRFREQRRENLLDHDGDHAADAERTQRHEGNHARVDR